MSYYICPKCGDRDEIFDLGEPEAIVAEFGVPFIGSVPLNASIRKFGYAGTLENTFTSADELVLEAVEIVGSTLAGQISMRRLQQTANPTLSI